MLRLIKYFYLFISCFFISGAFAQKDPDLKIKSEFSQHTVNHVIFNSTFVLPEVAKAAGIKRSKNESLLNVSIIPKVKGSQNSIAATITGTATNLMQQQKTLKFKEIKEKDAVYYLAPIRVANEELLRFRLSVTPEGSDEPLIVEFSQTVYADE